MGEQLRTLRRSRGETQRAVAQAIGISVNTISKFENGRSEKCGIGLLFELCRYYGVRPHELAGG